MFNINDDESKIKSNNFLSIDEKLKLAAFNKPTFKTPNPSLNNENQNLSLSLNPTKSTTIDSILNNNNLTGESLASRSNSIFTKGKKIFKIKKFIKYNKIINEFCSDDEMSDNFKLQEREIENNKDPEKRKISPFSKVNFSKLRVEEKDERLKNLALLVKRLRRKVRNLEHKVKFNATKLLNRHLWNKLGINSKNKYMRPEIQFDFDKICKALKKIRNSQDLEFSDEKNIIENIINLIAEGDLKINSLTFKRICSQIRLLLPSDKVKYIDKRATEKIIKTEEKEILISEKEYNSLLRYKENSDLMQCLYGLETKLKEEPSINHENKLHLLNEIKLNKSNKDYIEDKIIASEQNTNNNLFAGLLKNNDLNNSLFVNQANPNQNNINLTNLNTVNGLNNINNFNNKDNSFINNQTFIQNQSAFTPFNNNSTNINSFIPDMNNLENLSKLLGLESNNFNYNFQPNNNYNSLLNQKTQRNNFIPNNFVPQQNLLNNVNINSNYNNPNLDNSWLLNNSNNNNMKLFLTLLNNQQTNNQNIFQNESNLVNNNSINEVNRNMFLK